MDLFEQNDLLDKIDKLTAKWKDNKPEKFSSLYWRYRADQCLYLSYKQKLNSAKKTSEKLTKDVGLI